MLTPPCRCAGAKFPHQPESVRECEQRRENWPAWKVKQDDEDTRGDMLRDQRKYADD